MTGRVPRTVAPENRVTVTITPDGQFRDVTVGGCSIGRFIQRDDAFLALAGNEMPVLSLRLIPDEIVIKEPTFEAAQ